MTGSSPVGVLSGSCPVSPFSQLGSSLGSTLPAADSMLESTLPYRSGGGSGGGSLVCCVCGKRKRHVNGTFYLFYCKGCLNDIFPFSGVSSDREFKEATLGFSINAGHLIKAKKLRFNPLNEEVGDSLAEYRKTIGGCRYYDTAQFARFRQEYFSKNKIQLSLLCLNINGLPKKKDSFSVFLETLRHKFDIIGLTETHLNEVSSKYAAMEGYNLVSNSRTKKGWGGVAIYIRMGLTFRQRADIDVFEEGVLETIFIEIVGGNESLYIGVVYRPPGSNLTLFLAKMAKILEGLKGKRLHLMGDFNLDLIKGKQHTATGEFLTVLDNVGLYPLISLPTRITPKSATLIDNIFSTEVSSVSSGLILSSISDHLPSFAVFGGAGIAQSKESRFTLKRVMNDKGKERFRKWVKVWGESFMPRVDSVAEDAARFRNELRDEYNVCFPQKKVRIRPIDEKKPWLNDASFLNKVRARDKLYARQLKRRGGLSSVDGSRLRDLTDEVNRQRKDMKRAYFSQKLNETGKNSKQAWKVLHDFIGRSGRCQIPCQSFVRNGASITDDQDIAESFCEFYSEIGSDLASKIEAPTSGSFKDYLGPSPRGSLYLRETDAMEIESICLDLDPSKGPGHDGFSPSVIRHVASEMSVPLSRLINVCLEAGHFPEFLKVARVTPVFKADDPTQVGNYRPISVLSVFSKIFERVIQGRLLSYLNKEGSILGSQYGFRRGHSTDMAILDMVESIRKAWEKGEACLGVFIDFKKAFDTVDHCILLAKLEHLGIRGAPLELLRSYLSNRSQYVVFNGAESSRERVKIGVPQGSILGPLFFLLYINDLARASSLFRCILFADDTNLFASGKNQRDLYSKVRRELVNLSCWFAHNRLSLNYKKTEFIDFSKPAAMSPACRTTLAINDNPIKKVNESKFLGVLIDKDISWRGHIGKISNKVRQTVGIIGRARGFMNGAQLLLLYNTMVLPHLQYCLLNWGNFKGDGNLGLSGGILSLQKSLVRIVATSNNPVSHTDPLFAKFAVLKIDDLFEQRKRIFSLRLSRGMLPSGVASLFERASHSYNTRGARSNLYVGSSDARSMLYIVPKCWNSLPSALKASPSINSFRDMSKRGLLAPYSRFVCCVGGCLSCPRVG